jgi:hypothetical protein
MLLALILIFVSTVLGPTDGVSADVVSTEQAESGNGSLSNPATIGAPYPEGTCELAWFEASMIASDDIQDPSKDLDIALRTCQSTSNWMSQASKYPELLTCPRNMYHSLC